MKTCTKCGEPKTLSEFGKHSLSKNGINPWCKECVNASSRKWSKTPSGIYSNIKGRQLYLNRHEDSRSKPFDLGKDEFLEWYVKQDKVCSYCGLPEEHLELIANKYGSRWKRLTIDCKDNDVGYVTGNLVLACDKCNITKNNMLTYDEMMYVGQNFIKPKWQVLVQT